MKKLFLASITAAALLTVGSANAADLAMKPTYGPPPAVAPVLVYNWTGFYIGAGGGYGLFDVENKGLAPDGDVLSSNQTAGGRGWFGTVVGGYDYQFANPLFSNPIVAGVFVDADFSDIHGRLSDVDEEANAPLKQNRAWAIGGRVGLLVVPSVLSYFTVGFSQAHFTGGVFLGVNGAPFGPSLGSATFNGWFLGSGIETMLFGGFSIKTEYRLAEYNTGDIPVYSGDVNRERSRPFVQTIRTELIYRFNWGKGKAPVVASY